MDVEEILLGAVEKKSPAERVAYLEGACGSDAALRALVEGLLESHERAGSFLEQPLFEPTPTTDTPAAPEKLGAAIGPYKLLQQIGEGGMGTVFMAEQTHPVMRKVAIKVIKAGWDSGQVIARFEQEQQALAMMDHVNIARVLDAGATESGLPYFVMELVHGVPITKYCDDNHLTPRERLELFVPVCEAIQHAHQKGIIHRDVKPSNVLVTLYDGKAVPKVIDFGVAKATEHKLTARTLFTHHGTLVGTLEYMSPEQAEMSALGVDTRSDVYSLGVLLYELLTGSTPLSHKRVREAAYPEVVRMIKEEDPPRPSTRLSDSGEALTSISAQRRMEPAKLTRLVRGELDWIVMKCLEKERANRYESASALAADVRRYSNDEPVQACPPSALYRFRKFARRNKAALVTAAAVAVAVVLAVAGLATSNLLIGREQRATERALQAETRAKEELRRDANFHRITLAHLELSADNLGRALELLAECPEDLRGWEWHYLVRLCRVGPVIFHNDNNVEVTSLAFSADGERIASTDAGGAVKVWDSKTGQVIRRIEKAHGASACGVAFHPDGKHLASVGADKLVKVWDWKTGRTVFTCPCDRVHAFGSAYAVAFGPRDGRRLAVGLDGDVKVWDWKAEKTTHTFAGDDKHRLSVAFSPDGRRLASANWGGSINLWDLEGGGGGEPLRTFPRITPHPVVALAFSPDGRRLATASFARRVDVWDAAAGRLDHVLRHTGVVQCVAFSPDGQRIASGGEDKAVRVWDAATGREVLGLRGHAGWCGCVAFSPDPHGRRLATASTDGTIRIWDATPLEGHEGEETRTFRDGNEVWSLAISPDGQKIASAGWSRPTRVWDVRTEKVNVEHVGHREIVFCVAWSPDGKRIASAGGNRALFTVKVWDPLTGQDDFALPAQPGEPEFLGVAFSPDGRRLVTGRRDGTVQVWDAQTRSLVNTLDTHDRMVRGVVFSPDGLHLASVSSDGLVKLWDATRLDEKGQKSRHTLPARSHGQCLNVAFSPHGRLLATGGKENTVKIWDVQTGKELLTLRGHSGDVYAVAFSRDAAGRWVASGGEDSSVKVWDSRTGQLLRNFRGHTGLVSTLAFTPNGRSLVSGSRDHDLKIWDVTQLEEGTDR
jgi:WD40 repeat protein/serine/threonine protein kinase